MGNKNQVIDLLCQSILKNEQNKRKKNNNKQTKNALPSLEYSIVSVKDLNRKIY